MAPVENVSVVTPNKILKISGNGCKICCKKVIKGILCSVCNIWLHERCAKTSVNFVTNGESWVCDLCKMEKIHRLENELKTKDKVIELLKNDIVSLKHNLGTSSNNSMDKQYLSKHADESEVNQITATNENDLTEQANKSIQSHSDKQKANKIQKTSLNSASLNKIEIETKNRINVLNSKIDAVQKDYVPNRTFYNVGLQSENHEVNANINKKTTAGETMNPTSKKSVLIFGDSHVRKIPTLVHNTLDEGKYTVCGLVKPGGKAESFVENIISDSYKLNSDDFIVLSAGANNVYCNDSKLAIRQFIKIFSLIAHLNILVINVPHRHDLPVWSIVNKEIRKFNADIKKLCRKSKNISVLDVYNINRNCHTRHGLHLNSIGKRWLNDKICQHIKSKHKISDAVILLRYGEESLSCPKSEINSSYQGNVVMPLAVI